MKDLNIFASQRAIVDFYDKFEDGLLPKAIGFSEFLQNLLYVKNLKRAEDSTRLRFMYQASKLCELKDLALPREFFAFLKNNDYIFSFFTELSKSKKTINDIKFSDIYLNFEEHLEILDQLLTIYKNLLFQNGFYDEISLSDFYEINENYILNFENIIVYLTGILSEFEWEILFKISKIKNLKIIFQSSKFNQKLLNKINSFVEFKFEENCEYELNLTNLNICLVKKLGENKNVLFKKFKLRSMQVPYVFEKISYFLSKGIVNIAIILPDEDFSDILRLYDEKRILNFTMGEKFSKHYQYQILDAINESIKNSIKIDFNEEYLKNQVLEKFSTIFNFYNLNKNIYFEFLKNYDKDISFNEFEKLILSLNLDHDIIKQELFFMKNLSILENLKLKEFINLFLLRLANNSLDLYSQSKIRVMGLLESRGLKFDGLIIVDFNDEFVPKRSINEMFLNSKIRKRAGLISYKDRENLQRFYYERLINEAKIVAISCSDFDDKIPSRFLKEFNCIDDENFSQNDYLTFFRNGTDLNFKEEQAFCKMPEKLSYSALNTFLQCPRKYFYRYEKNIKPQRLFNQKSNVKNGDILHKILETSYVDYRFNFDIFLDKLSSSDMSLLDKEIYAKKFYKFKINEDLRYDMGYRVFQLEVDKKCDFMNFRLCGTIDRIDKIDNKFCLIDYKSGKLPDSSLQLEFYKKLLGDDDCEAYFYDLKYDMDLKIPKKIDNLEDKLQEFKEAFGSEFERNLNSCLYCEFKSICKGEAC